MKVAEKLGLLLCLFGLIMYLPPISNWATLHLGGSISRFAGIVSFAVGWAVGISGLAFSAGIKYQNERIKKG